MILIKHHEVQSVDFVKIVSFTFFCNNINKLEGIKKKKTFNNESLSFNNPCRNIEPINGAFQREYMI